MARGLILSFLAFILTHCTVKHEYPFDSKKWKDKGLDWWMTDFRESMMNDLVDSDTLSGLSKIKILDLLGEPESKGGNVYNYLIREKYESDIDPVYIKHLKIGFDSTGIVKTFRIEESR